MKRNKGFIIYTINNISLFIIYIQKSIANIHHKLQMSWFTFDPLNGAKIQTLVMLAWADSASAVSFIAHHRLIQRQSSHDSYRQIIIIIHASVHCNYYNFTFQCCLPPHPPPQPPPYVLQFWYSWFNYDSVLSPNKVVEIIWLNVAFFTTCLLVWLHLFLAPMGFVVAMLPCSQISAITLLSTMLALMVAKVGQSYKY